MKKIRTLHAVILIFILLFALAAITGCENAKEEITTGETIEETTENETEDVTEKQPDPYYTDFPENEEEMLQRWEDVIVERNIEIESMRIVHVKQKHYYQDADRNSEHDQTFVDQDKITYIIEAIDLSNVQFNKTTLEGNDFYIVNPQSDFWGINGNNTLNSYGIVINLSDKDQNMILGFTVDLDGYIHICTPSSRGYVYKSTEPLSFETFEDKFYRLCFPYYYETETEDSTN